MKVSKRNTDMYMVALEPACQTRACLSCGTVASAAMLARRRTTNKNGVIGIERAAQSHTSHLVAVALRCHTVQVLDEIRQGCAVATRKLFIDLWPAGGVHRIYQSLWTTVRRCTKLALHAAIPTLAGQCAY